MPNQNEDDTRRRQDRLRRRTTKLDGFFAFDQGGEAESSLAPLYPRGGAEKRASEILTRLPRLPSLVVEAGKPAGPGTTGLKIVSKADVRVGALALAAGRTSFFARGGEGAGELRELVDRVGSAAFRNLTVLAFFHDFMAPPLSWYGYGPRGLWRHSAATAVAAWRLGQALGLHKVACETLFLGGLLHDVGKPTLQGLLGAAAPPPEVASMSGSLTVLEAEVRTVNMTHTELVPLMLDIWGVEHDIFPVAEHHHAPQRAGTMVVQAGAIQLADMAANAAGVGLDGDYGFSLPPLDRTAGKIGLTVEQVSAVQENLGMTVAEMASAMESVPSPGGA